MHDDLAGVNGLNQMTSSGALSLSYDAKGNLGSDGTNSYGYDTANRLNAASGASMAYDPLGRLYETVGSASTRFVYDGPNLIEERSSSGALLRRYVPGEGMDEPLVWYEGAGTGAARFLAADHLGSIVSVSDASGNVVATNTYDAYGAPGAANQGRYQYTGQIFVPEAGLYHYKARAYSPSLGRFLQTDPIGYLDGMNLYA